MDLSLRREAFATSKHSWLGSEHGVGNAHPVTLDLSTFTKSTHYPDGFLRAGTPLKINGTSKKAEPALTDGTAEPAGYLLEAVQVPLDGSDRDPVGAILEHGRIVVANLPVAFTKPTAPSGRFVYA